MHMHGVRHSRAIAAIPGQRRRQLPRNGFPSTEAAAAPDSYIYRYRCTCSCDSGWRGGSHHEATPMLHAWALPRLHDDRLTASLDVSSWVALCFGAIAVSAQR